MDRHAMIEETFLAPIGCALVSRDTQIIERAGWYQLVTPSTGTSQGNEVALSQLAPGDVDRIVDETVAQYAAHRVPFKWAVGPLTEPADFGAALDRHGFSSYPVRGMAIDPAQWIARALRGVTVDLVTEANLAEYYDTWSRGWDIASPDPAEWRAEHSRAIATGRFHFYLARVDGEPAATAGFITKPRCAYMIGGNVLPAFRSRGLYRALLDARLAAVAERGIPLAVTHARESTSAPILEHLGFESLFRGFVYRWQP